MIKYALITISALFTLASQANPQECESKLFNQFKQLTKSEYQLPNRKPTVQLSSRMTDFEIICPWQVEVDFDGDRRRDWIGLVNKGDQTILAGYFSYNGKSQFIEIWQYPSFPYNTHLSFMTLKEFKLISDRPEKVSKSLRFGLVVNRIDKPSQVLQWNGKTMEEIGSYQGSFQSEPENSN